MGTDLQARALTDDAAGATLTGRAGGYERTVRIGAGESQWIFASTEVLRWGIKTRSGFAVEGNPSVVIGRRYWLIGATSLLFVEG